MTASVSNLQSCANCRAIMPRLLAAEHLHYCCPECVHDWSSRVLEAQNTKAAWEVLNRLRAYLKARCDGAGEEVSFAYLCAGAAEMFGELPLQQFIGPAAIVRAMTAESDTAFDFGGDAVE